MPAPDMTASNCCLPNPYVLTCLHVFVCVPSAVAGALLSGWANYGYGYQAFSAQALVSGNTTVCMVSGVIGGGAWTTFFSTTCAPEARLIFSMDNHEQVCSSGLLLVCLQPSLLMRQGVLQLECHAAHTITNRRHMLKHISAGPKC